MKTHTVAFVQLLDGIDVYNIGHGYVWPRKDGDKVRCLGPGVCKQCTYDNIRKDGNMIDKDFIYSGSAVAGSTIQKYEAKESINNTQVKLDIAVRLLEKVYNQFRQYERNHREKMIDPTITKEKLLETFDKAETNAAWAKEIKDQLDAFRKQEE